MGSLQQLPCGSSMDAVYWRGQGKVSGDGGGLGQVGGAKASAGMHSGGVSPVFLWWLSGTGGMGRVCQLSNRYSILLGLCSGWMSWFSD